MEDKEILLNLLKDNGLVAKNVLEEKGTIVNLILEKIKTLTKFLEDYGEMGRTNATLGEALGNEKAIVTTILEQVSFLSTLLDVCEENGDSSESDDTYPINDNRNVESEQASIIDAINTNKSFEKKNDEGQTNPIEEKNNEEEQEKELDAVTEDKAKKSISCELIKSTTPTLGVIYGIANQAEFQDSEGDIISLEDLRKAAHNFVENSRKGNIDHEGGVDGTIVESLILDKDFINLIKSSKIEENSWLIGWKPFDPEIAKAASEGDFVGFSIEGRGRRQR